ncbi:MAG: BPSS1780 family membrane protein [Janthinobacterium lividum]
MQLNEVTAKTGYVWFRQGIWLFRRNPLGFLTLFFAYAFAMMIVSLVPVAGSVLPLILIPGVSVGFMAACREGVQRKPFFPNILISGFRRCGPVAARRLLLIGIVYAVCIVLVFAVSALADGGMLMKMMLLGSQPTDAAVATGNLPMAVLLAVIAYIPVAMIFWFAPVLIAWHDVPPQKAVFFSLVACWRNRGAFLIYGAIWVAVIMLVSFVLTSLLHVLGAGAAGIAILMPVSLVVTTMLYCSFYATYRGCFGINTEEVEPIA